MRGRGTYLADSGLEHGIEPALGGVHVPRDPLLLDDTCELGHVLGDRKDVDEAVRRATLDLILPAKREREGGRDRERRRE